MYLLALYFLLFLLFSLEASTSIARMAGVLVGNQVTGLTLQSSLGIFSRFLMLVFMPVLGYMADTSKINTDFIVELNFLIVASLYVLIRVKSYVLAIYLQLVNNVNTHGTYFKQASIFTGNNKIFKNVTLRFKSLYIIFIIAYIPYYLSWPIVLIFLSKYPDYRAMIIGMSGLLNGFNTVINAIIIDPKLSQMSSYKRVCAQVHNDLLYMRMVSAAIASVFLMGVLFVI